MSRFSDRALNVPAAIAAGTATGVDDLTGMSLLFSGAFTGTYQPQVSEDGVNWSNLGAAITAPGTTALTGAFRFLRLNCTAFTSAPASVFVTGTQNRSS